MSDFLFYRGRFLGRIKLLLAHKADVSIANSKKELPLHRVCSSNSTIEAVLFLAEMSDNIDIQDADGWTPLMYAAKSKSSAVVKYLLQRNADPNKQQVSVPTNTHMAACYYHLFSSSAQDSQLFILLLKLMQLKYV